MSDAEGPKDGDFVAYVDRLQQQSALRLRAQSLPVPTVAAIPEPTSDVGAVPQENQRPALPSRNRFVLAGAVLGLGSFLSLLSLSFTGFFFTLFLSAGLLLWALATSRAANRLRASKNAAQLQRVVAGRFGGRVR